MRIILTGDLHIKEGLYLQVGLDYIDYLYNYAKENNINSIAFLGDIINKENRVKAETFIPLFKKMEFLKDEGFDNYILLGNHDIISTLTNSSLLETFSRFGHLVQSPETFDFDGTIINMAPYTRDENLVPTVNADYLFTHLAIVGFDFGNKIVADGIEHQAFPVSMFANYKKVFTGHFHKRQLSDNIEYIGSPYQLNFGDAGDLNKGFVVFDTATGEEEFVRYTFAPKYITYNYDDLWKNIKSETINISDLQNNLVKIVVNKKVDELSKLKSVLYNAYGVVDITNEFEAPKDTIISETRVEIGTPISDMIEEFISKIHVTKDGYDITGENLVDKFREIKGECK